jgi:hypothetical protein
MFSLKFNCGMMPKFKFLGASNATTCRIIADFLEDKLRDAEIRVGSSVTDLQGYLKEADVTYI